MPSHVARISVAVAILATATLLGAAVRAQPADPAAHVDPFLGTAGDGAVFPGAVRPFGLVQWSPDTGTAPGGYRYDDTAIQGFSPFHLSGVGCPHGQDVSVMPVTGPLSRSPVGNRTAYASPFRHATETASPGAYGVRLDRYGLDVRLAAALRAGIAEVIAAPGEAPALVLDPDNAATAIRDLTLRLDPARREITGRVVNGGFCGKQNQYTLYFALRTEEAWTDFGLWRGARRYDRALASDGTDGAAFVRLPAGAGPHRFKIAVSLVSVDGARRNLAEIAGWDAEVVRREARADWNRRLARIETPGATPETQTVVATALYHALLHPNVVEDADGRVRGYDGRVRQTPAGQGHVYANFSLWDTYRTQAALLGMLFPDEAADMVRSLVLAGDECGGLPVWGFLNSDTGVMSGYPADPFAATVAAFVPALERQPLLDRMVATATETTACTADGGWWYLDAYRDAFIAAETTPHGPASYQLEYAVADFSTARVAEMAGDTATAARFDRRARSWQALFNPASGYVEPRREDGSWPAGFDPTAETGFMEGNAAQQTWLVPHDAGTLLAAIERAEPVEPRLDAFFSRIVVEGWATREPYYWAGNEPVLHTPWLYHWLGRPDKTQATVERIVDAAFTTGPRGLPGNDDAGTMSAWVLFATMGLYPSVPGVAGFSVHAPLTSVVRLNLAGGRTVEIRRDGAGAAVSSVGLGGADHASSWASWADLTVGGILAFAMSDTPGAWGRAVADRPPSFTPDGPRQVAIRPGE